MTTPIAAGPLDRRVGHQAMATPDGFCKRECPYMEAWEHPFWQPIETAPTDGTRILLRGRGGKIADGHYGQPDGWANPKRFVWPYIHANPTHWMPLPAPPIGRCIPCRETGALHCHDPLHCGGPWSEAPQNDQHNRPAFSGSGLMRQLGAGR